MAGLGDRRGQAAHLAEVLKGLSHPDRLRIVATLCEGERNVGDLAKRLGLRPAAVSQHLSILRMRGLVATQRRQGFACYRIAIPKLRQLVRCLEGCRTAESEGGGR
jgi:DNA-binding transcriptional ArsR family regulator